MTKISEPGVYLNIPEKDYHADPCIEPSLSKSIGKHLLQQTPKHCQLAHPRLNPDFVEVNKTDFDLGKAAHRLLLEGRKGFAIVNAKDFRTSAAKEARDMAYAGGKIPLITSRLEEVEAMVESAKGQIRGTLDVPHVLDTHDPEVTLIWIEDTAYGKVYCRCRVDLMPRKGTIVVDYKTTTDANPENWRNRAFDLGFDLQAGWIRRGMRALGRAENADMRFIVQETKAPYVLSVVGLEPEAIEMGDEKAAAMLEEWARCRAKNYWPGYFKSTVYMGPPPWEVTKWKSRQMRPEQYGVTQEEWLQMGIDMQAPVEEDSP